LFEYVDTSTNKDNLLKMERRIADLEIKLARDFKYENKVDVIIKQIEIMTKNIDKIHA